MKSHSHRLRRLALATLASAAFAAPVMAQDFGPLPPNAAVPSQPAAIAPAAAPEPILIPAPIAVEVESGIHAGANNPVDNELAARVAGALADEPRLDGATVTVSAAQGRVSLSGSADSPEQASVAEQVARRVDGVSSVSGTLSPTGG